MAGRNRSIASLVGLFRLLSEPVRLRILLLLDQGEWSVGELCRRLRLPQPTVSHHLAILRGGQLVSPRRCGKEVYYGIANVRKGSAGRVLRSVLKQPNALRLGPIVMQLAKAGR